MSADPHRPQGAQDPSRSPPPVAVPLANPAWPAPPAPPPPFPGPIPAPAISPMAPYSPGPSAAGSAAPLNFQQAPVIDTTGRSRTSAAPAAPKPIGRTSARPLQPAAHVPSKGAGPLITPVIAAANPDETPPDITEAAVKSAPPFLVSMFTHMLLIIILALITLHQATKDNVELQAVYAESLGQQLLDDKLQSPESLDMQAETPVLSFDIKPANDPLAAPPKLPDFFADANKATSNIDAPDIGMALTGREPGLKKALLPVYGGNATTEGAVLLGLEWLKRNQMKDGGWSLAGPYPDGSNSGDNRCSATAMALLAFQGYGATHKPGSSSPDFHDVVERGWNFLLKMQDKDGFFQHEGTNNSRMYAQAQASIAICEIYGMTKDPKFKRPAQLALDFAHKAQSPELGGWRYEPRIDSDTSVTGWYVMALQSGRMAGLEVQSPNLDLINKFLDRVAREGGTQYAYQIGEPASRLTMTAEALLCRQYLGWKHDDPRMRAGIDQLLANRINYDDDPNVYYWYYATQACHHMDGNDWYRWNEVMRQAVPAAQTKTGNDRGSWHPNSDRWGSHGGRLYVTCLSVFMLETYYRHLPIYKWRLQ